MKHQADEARHSRLKNYGARVFTPFISVPGRIGSRQILATPSCVRKDAALPAPAPVQNVQVIYKHKTADDCKLRRRVGLPKFGCSGSRCLV